MQKIILFYLFTPLKDTEAIKLWQTDICERFELKGRIIISKHGINGTLGGNIDNVKKYISKNKTYLQFKKIVYKWSDGSNEDFPKLSVKVRDEIVSFGAENEINVNITGIVGGGKHIKPKQLHELIKNKKVIFMDGRNKYEAEIGKFKGAITPTVNNTREFIKEIEKPKYDKIKDKPIVTYCTGGIRCEVLSTLMINRGFKEVYQLEGGIVKYIEDYKDDGLWEGSLYVFDKRMGLKPTDKTKDIGLCIFCKEKTSKFINCENKSCNQLILVCKNCNKKVYCNECLKIKVAK